MAAPTYQQQSSLFVIQTGQAFVFMTEAGNADVGDVIILGIMQDGTGTNPTVSLSGVEGQINSLDGTANAMDSIGTFNVGNPTAAKLHLWIGRLAAWGATDFEVSVTTAGDDLYCALWAFRGVSSGTTLATVIENGAGTTNTSVGTSTSVTDAAVDTNGADRLALNFVGINDDATGLATFVGATNGTWTATGGVLESSTGTDGTIACFKSTVTSGLTIDGGSDTITSDGWGVVGFALLPAGATTHSGAVVSPFTFTPVEVGRINFKTNPVVAPQTFNRVVTGKLTAKSRVDSPFTFGSVTNGARLAKGAVDSPFTFGEVVQAKLTAKARVDSPFTVERVVQAKVDARSRIDSPFSFDRVIAAKLSAKSAVVLPFGFGEVVQAKLTAKGVVISPFSFGVSVIGSTPGAVVVSPFTVNIVVVGKVGMRSAVVFPIVFGVVTDGFVTPGTPAAGVGTRRTLVGIGV